MKIIALTEDSQGNDICAFEHGLSLYIETENHTLLLDTGATGMFAENAEKLGLDLTKADTLILSHGHYDHGGGILKFAQLNEKASIYIHKNAFGDFYNGSRYIGIDKRISGLEQVIMVDGDLRIDNELMLFTGIKGRRLFSQSNLTLTEKTGNEYIQDSFSHEQCLVITAADGNYLLSACSHNGILNIIDRYNEIFDDEPKVVISGFHMMKRSEYTDNEINTIQKTAQELVKMNTLFFTGHCTSQPAYDIMKPIMKDKLMPIKSGIRLI